MSEFYIYLIGAAAGAISTAIVLLGASWILQGDF